MMFRLLLVQQNFGLSLLESLTLVQRSLVEGEISSRRGSGEELMRSLNLLNLRALWLRLAFGIRCFHL